MEINDAQTMARNLMDSHGFSHMKFGFNRRKVALGVCRFLNKKPVSIELSSVWVPYLSEDEVKDVILHEIAHAIAGFDAKHGVDWRMVARRIGANPTRTAEGVPNEVTKRVNSIHAKYVAKCEKCANMVHFNRMTERWRRRSYVCAICRGSFLVSSQ